MSERVFLSIDDPKALTHVLGQAVTLMMLVEECENDVPEEVFQRARSMRAVLIEHGTLTRE